MTNFSLMSAKTLNDHLGATARKLSAERGEPVDRVRKKIAFDFLLNRLSARAPGGYVLKGGYAIEKKFNIVRATKDIDLVTKAIFSAAMRGDADGVAKLLRQKLVDDLAEPVGSMDQHVRFKIAPGVRVVRGGGGGVQLAVVMLIGTARFTEFSIDLSMEDIVNPPREILPMRPIIDGLNDELTGEVPADELVFAEKLHAYLRQSDDFKAREKDFVDLAFLARRDLDKASCRRLIREVFDYWQREGAARGLTALPPPPVDVEALTRPPEAWRPVYDRMAREMGLDLGMDEAFALLAKTLHEILSPR